MDNAEQIVGLDVEFGRIVGVQSALRPAGSSICGSCIVVLVYLEQKS